MDRETLDIENQPLSFTHDFPQRQPVDEQRDKGKALRFPCPFRRESDGPVTLTGRSRQIPPGPKFTIGQTHAGADAVRIGIKEIAAVLAFRQCLELVAHLLSVNHNHGFPPSANAFGHVDGDEISAVVMFCGHIHRFVFL
jgi:hypothetical protein